VRCLRIWLKCLAINPQRGLFNARIETELAGDPAFSVLCSNSSEAFDSGIVIGPDWQLAPAHLPTILSFFALVVLAAAGFWGVSRSVSVKIGMIPRPKDPVEALTPQCRVGQTWRRRCGENSRTVISLISVGHVDDKRMQGKIPNEERLTEDESLAESSDLGAFQALKIPRK
jgi:hypothetical protein